MGKNKYTLLSNSLFLYIVILAFSLITLLAVTLTISYQKSLSINSKAIDVAQPTKTIGVDGEAILKNLTKKLLKSERKYEQASGQDKESALIVLSSIASQRKQAIIDLLEQDQQSILRSAFSLSMKQSFAPQIQQDIEEAVSLEGDLDHQISDNFRNRTTKEHYFLKTIDNQNYDLFFIQNPDLPAGAQIKINGIKIQNKIIVDSSDTVNVEVQNAQSLGANTPIEKKVAVIMFNFKNDSSQPFSSDFIRRVIFTDTNSSRAALREASFNQLNMSGKINPDGDIFGWYTINFDNTNCESNYSTWSTAARSAAQTAGVDLSGYTNIIYAFHASCWWAGRASMPGNTIWFSGFDPASYIYVENASNLAHEFMHNLGAHHSNSYTCRDGSGIQIPISTNCTSGEYGDPSDIMGNALSYSGGGSVIFRPGGKSGLWHVNNYHKARAGWLGSSNIQTVTASGTYTLNMQENNTPSVQLIRIPRNANATSYYYLELRKPFGFDDYEPTWPIVNRVAIRIAPNYNQSVQTQLIDATSNSLKDTLDNFLDGGIAEGQFFEDSSAGIRINIQSVTSDSATMQITLGQSSCIHSNPTVGISPLSQWGYPGENKTYSITVTNNDSSACTSSVFTITPNLPASNWIQNPSSSSLSLSPGATNTIQVSITSPSTAIEDLYTFTETAVNTGVTQYFGSASANYNVSLPNPTPTPTSTVPTPTSTPSIPTPTIIQDTISPIVTISSPINGSLVSNNMTISASAQDNVQVVRMELFIDTVLKRNTNLDSISYKWNTRKIASGLHTITVKAYDSSTNAGVSSITVIK